MRASGGASVSPPNVGPAEFGCLQDKRSLLIMAQPGLPGMRRSRTRTLTGEPSLPPASVIFREEREHTHTHKQARGTYLYSELRHGGASTPGRR